MLHYTCSSCGGVAKSEGVCQTDNCVSKGNSLMACENCTNPDHEKKLSSTEGGEKEAKADLDEITS